MQERTMHHMPIPLQRTLAVSLGIHVLVFGTALAFAQYTGGLFRNEGTVITVALVSGGGGGGAARSAGRETARDIARRMPVDAMPTALPIQGADSALPAEAKTGETGSQAAVSEGAGIVGGDQGEGTSSVAASGVDGGAAAFSSEQWGLLYSAIERAKTYPRLARERGIEGTVLVRFKVLPSGTIDTVNIVRSSGAEILDEASVRTVYRAAPMPYVNGWIEVPMSYILK
jgi:TonB family protein